MLKLISESGIAAGVRRIEALTGLGALAWLREQERRLRRIGETLRVPPAEAPERVERLLEERREKEREIEKLRRAKRGAGSQDLASKASSIDGTRVLAARAEGATSKELRELVYDLRG